MEAPLGSALSLLTNSGAVYVITLNELNQKLENIIVYMALKQLTI